MEKGENWDGCMPLDFYSRQDVEVSALIRSIVRAESQLISKPDKQRSDLMSGYVLPTAFPPLLLHWISCLEPLKRRVSVVLIPKMAVDKVLVV